MSDVSDIYCGLDNFELCEYATLSSNSKGRVRNEDGDFCDIRTPFMRDRDRIIHSKSFRRLMHKTQCFLSPEGDHYRTRLTHTLEVSQISRTIARALHLNEDLTEAIALGHDLGHTPFGHAGERELDKLCPDGFKHNEQSLRVVDLIEREGLGLNLTYEVRDGILCHTGDKDADTPEGQIIKLADRIAYINHDIDDAVRAGVLGANDIPFGLRAVLGDSHSKRIDTMVKSIIRATSKNFKNGICKVSMEANMYDSTMTLRKFLFDNVYFNPVAKSEETKACDMINKMYEYFCIHTDKIPFEYRKNLEIGDSVERTVCDYIACMTDRFAVQTFQNLFIPKKWAIL